MKTIMLKRMFLKVLLSVFLCSIALASYADFAVNFKAHTREYKTCNKCNYGFNDVNASFCSNCGETFQQPVSVFYRCPRCRFPFILTESNSFTRCDNCNHLNKITNRFCSSCGAKIFVRRVIAECPQCSFQSEGSCPYTENQKRYCRKCGNHYYANYRRCPYCEYHNKRRRNYDKNDYHSSASYNHKYSSDDRYPENNKKYHTKKHTYYNRSTLISSFTKRDYSKFVKKISIAAICSQQSFSKVVVDVKKTGKYTPILNMIKIKHNNRYLEYSQGVRLNEGKNQFVVNVPENSSQLVLSFDHGKGATVNIYLE